MLFCSHAVYGCPHIRKAEFNTCQKVEIFTIWPFTEKNG